jgi:hypothetical protein
MNCAVRQLRLSANESGVADPVPAKADIGLPQLAEERLAVSRIGDSFDGG